MLRSRALDRSLARLALLAVLLLALAPSVSRVLAAGSTQVLAGWSQLCTGMGLKAVASTARSPGDAGFAPASLPAGSELCGYCPLAASLPLLVLFLVFLLPVPPRALTARATPRRRTLANFRGLGGQGPPVLS